MARPKKVATAARSGSRRDTLIALRDHLAKRIDECESGRDSAALTKRLMEVMDELETLPDPNAKTKTAVEIAREKVAARHGPS